MKEKLANMHSCSVNDLCGSCAFKGTFASYHKATYFLKWLDCKEKMREEYYSMEKKPEMYNSVAVDFMRESYGKYKL